MSFSSRSVDKKLKSNHNIIRAWPLFVISFIRLFYSSIFDRALLNHLYFAIGIDESTLGIISSAGALAYIFTPLIGQQITKKIGIRNALIISCISTPILTFAQIIYFETWYLITIRVVLSLAIGLNWPNCFNLLSKWQEVSNPEKASRHFNYFNFSWNIGFIGGLITGYLWAFVWNDYFAMMISFFISFLLIPFSFYLQDVPTEQTLYFVPMDEIVEKLPPVTEDKDPKVETMMMAFPILYSWIGLVMMSISKSIVIFSYPIIIKDINENLSDLTYLIQAGIQAGQVLGITWINSMNPSHRKLSVPISVMVIAFFTLLIFIFRQVVFISVISISMGLFFGLIHGVSMKIMLDYGTVKNTSKYSTINEVIIGMGFGITPIIAGYVAEIDIYSMFSFIVLLGIVIFFYFIFVSKKIKWANNEKSNNDDLEVYMN